MYQKEEIVEKLGIQDWPEDKQNETVEVAIYRIGTAVTSELSEQQLTEYEAIINDNHNVINAWLDHNVPEYRGNPLYQEFEAAYNDDPEQNNPAKLFASAMWIQVNVPNVQALITSALEAYKQELTAA